MGNRKRKAPCEKQNYRIIVRGEDPTKCRCEQRPFAQVPNTACEPWKLTSANFQIPPSIAYQPLFRFLYLQMLPKQLNGHPGLWTTGMLLPRNGHATWCPQHYISLRLGSHELNWVVALVWVGPPKHHSKFYDDCNNKMLWEMHCFLCGKQCLFKSLWETFWHIQSSSPGPRKSD